MTPRTLLLRLLKPHADPAVVKELYARLFQGHYHTGQCFCPGGDSTIESLHSKDGSESYFRTLRKVALRPSKEGACGTDMSARYDDQAETLP